MGEGERTHSERAYQKKKKKKVRSLVSMLFVPSIRSRMVSSNSFRSRSAGVCNVYQRVVIVF